LVAFLQVVPLLSSFFLTHTSWHFASENLGLGWGTVSADPSATLFSLPSLICPYLCFIACVTLFHSAHDAILLLKAITFSGALISVYAILSFEFFPTILVFSEKVSHTDSLTGTFLNRNTAASFLGSCAIVVTGFLGRDLFHLGETNVRRFVRGELKGHRRRLRSLSYHAIALIILLVAIALTKSRAGMVASITGVIICAALMLSSTLPRRPVLFAGFFVLLMIIVSVVFGLTLQRAEAQGTDDWRWCTYTSIINYLFDPSNLIPSWIGSGFSSFARVYPAMRSIDCVITGTWDRAHSVYLETIISFGWGGVVPILFSIGILFFYFFKFYRLHIYRSYIPSIGMGLLVLILLHSSVDYSLQIMGFAMFFAAILGALLIAINSDEFSLAYTKPHS